MLTSGIWLAYRFADLLAKTEGGDHIALEVKYHLACLTKLRNCHRSLMKENQESVGSQSKEKVKQAKAFAQ